MKKALMICMGIAALVVFSSPAFAAVTGVCSGCHTMHNSQGGSAMATGGPLPTLLTDSCLGCHTGGSDPYDGGYPYVAGTGFTDSKCLAGGFFSTGGGNHNDNSHTLGELTPPIGYDSTVVGSDWYSGDSTGLGCAGSAGCHGVEDEDDESEAIAGGHHGNSAALGYRMLTVGGNKVLGTGTTDYEEALIAAEGVSGTYNLYSADPDSTIETDAATISELCAKCHGLFHQDGAADGTNDGTSWIRHPSDTILPSDWTLQGAAYTTKDAYWNPVGTQDAVTPIATNKYVTCISCHRAHGTENNDLLRFPYADQQAGSTTVDYGCLGCHNKQQGS
ncbi:MAG: cytochrome c3 family protein [Thermodesulfobacteriota bacterium]|nr:cytochrome c3 family protein [Thermodesulfobacteriota bacterium]